MEIKCCNSKKPSRVCFTPYEFKHKLFACSYSSNIGSKGHLKHPVQLQFFVVQNILKGKAE